MRIALGSVPAIVSASRELLELQMGFTEPTRNTERGSLCSELENWFLGQGVAKEGASRAVQLLDAKTLLAHPRPSRWNRRGQFSVGERCRYLWYRHAARILGWCDRKRFPDFVTEILRVHIFPSDICTDETSREDGEGGLAVGAADTEPDVHANLLDGGEFISITSHFCSHALGLGFNGRVRVLGDGGATETV